MFSHIMVGSNDVDRSKKFYDALFGVLGVQPATPDPRGRLARNLPASSSGPAPQPRRPPRRNRRCPGRPSLRRRRRRSRR
jgi:hypothetical protein